MADRVSWLVIERGWRVVGTDGADLGQVDELVGDTGIDIFNGLSVRGGALSKARYVPAERVSEIYDGVVTLDVSDLDGLEDYDEPKASERFEAP
jgi:hypothetical protein